MRSLEVAIESTPEVNRKLTGSGLEVKTEHSEWLLAEKKSLLDNADGERIRRKEIINILELLSQFKMADSQFELLNKRLKMYITGDLNSANQTASFLLKNDIDRKWVIAAPKSSLKRKLESL